MNKIKLYHKPLSLNRTLDMEKFCCPQTKQSLKKFLQEKRFFPD